MTTSNKSANLSIMKQQLHLQLPRMYIYSPKGTRVIYDAPNNGYLSCQKRLAKHGLIVGRVYVVESTDVSSYTTSVYLQGFEDIPFNSVNFGQL